MCQSKLVHSSLLIISNEREFIINVVLCRFCFACIDHVIKLVIFVTWVCVLTLGLNHVILLQNLFFYEVFITFYQTKGIFRERWGVNNILQVRGKYFVVRCQAVDRLLHNE